MFHTLKIGDTVSVLDTIQNRRSDTFRNRVNTRLTVAAVSPRNVRFKEVAGLWAASRFEFVPPADEVKVGTYIVSIKHPNGTLAPAPTPRVYSTDAQARKVAEQMATKHGGTFLVFKATDEFVMPTAKAQHRAL